MPSTGISSAKPRAAAILAPTSSAPASPGPLSIGDGVEGSQIEPGRRKRLPDERQYPPDVVAGGKFRHHAAILAVHFRLGIKRVA